MYRVLSSLLPENHSDSVDRGIFVKHAMSDIFQRFASRYAFVTSLMSNVISCSMSIPPVWYTYFVESFDKICRKKIFVGQQSPTAHGIYKCLNVSVSERLTHSLKFMFTLKWKKKIFSNSIKRWYKTAMIHWLISAPYPLFHNSVRIYKISAKPQK